MRKAALDSLTLTVEETAEILGISRSLAYELANTNQLPAPVIRLGRRLVVSRVALDRALAVSQPTLQPDTDPDPDAAAPAAATVRGIAGRHHE